MADKKMNPMQIKSMASDIMGDDSKKPVKMPPPIPDDDMDDDESADASGKISEQQAGYLELEGAQKDADCTKVQVQGGISKDKGCCSIIGPVDGAEYFNCGSCKYLDASGVAGE